MTVTFKGYFIQQADYQHWANEVLFAALEHLDDGMRNSDQGLPCGGIHQTLDRILAETRNWAARLKGDGQSIGPDTLLCAEWQELKDALRREVRGVQHWLEEMPENYFEERVFYHSGAERQSLWVRDALTHLMTRMVHYRGEVSVAVARLGFAAPEMDYVRYKEEMEQHIARLKEAEEERRAEKP
jgi:uncharacterized damage-inducible protein DinB